tara:strand:+ start:76 stop:828 length:753 start_codon:yes stop_codon:yes gene_type:complete
MRNDKSGWYNDFNINKIPLEPDYNVLAFIREHNRLLDDWERDVIHIVEQNSLYFIPQAKTKVMNEGWAVLIHEKIMKELDLPTEYRLGFIRLHNQVIRPHLGRVNPYHLGYKIFRHIEDKYGFEACMIARESHNDETFIKKYLDEDLCNELNLFSFAFNRKDGYHRITDVSGTEGWRTIRDDLIKNIGLNSAPVVFVEDLQKDGTLVLKHEHDGRDLDLAEANRVFSFINELWSAGVKFTTIIEDETWEF